MKDKNKIILLNIFVTILVIAFFSSIIYAIFFDVIHFYKFKI